MNRYERDLVLRAAFGDLDPHEEPTLQRLLERDAEAQREYESLKDVRGELGALREAPECQVSVERLRDALLKETLQANSRPKASWLWALSPAVGLAALALAWVVTQEPGPTALEVASAPDRSQVGMQTAESAPTPFQPMPIAPPESPLLDQPSPSLETFETPPAVAEARSSPTPNRQELVLAYTPAPTLTQAVSMTVSTVASEPYPSQAAIRVDQPEPQVVIVTGLESAETGARVATEADHNEHVVFGG